MPQGFHYGGQAVIEGVMMRGQRVTATVVRHPKGHLVTRANPLPSFYTGGMRKTPMVRGVTILAETMVLGIRSLMFSANVALEEEGEEKPANISGGFIWGVMVVSLVLAVGLFFLAPLFLANLLDPYVESSLLFHLVEGLIRLVIFVAYLRIIGSFGDIKRTFAYHGAEHKTINAIEDGAPLEVANVRKYSTAHTRCGTSFLLAVLVIAIIVFALVGQQALWLMILTRVMLLPVIAALGYEATRYSANHPDNLLVRLLRSPGLWLQRLTTREPDDSQLEVAMAALEKVMAFDRAVEEAQAVRSAAVSS
jgi:uncharacterized protein YqhQ